MKQTDSGVTFSHVGIYVHSLADMERFYVDLLGFTVTDRGDLRRGDAVRSVVFLSRDPDEHHQIVLATGRPAELAFNPINQISMRVESLATLRGTYRRFLEAGRQGLDPVSHGNSISFYAPDPEGNRIEIYWNTPWYVSQPRVETIDLLRPDEELMPMLEQVASLLPGFRPRAQWRAEMAARMGLSAETPTHE